MMKKILGFVLATFLVLSPFSTTYSADGALDQSATEGSGSYLICTSSRMYQEFKPTKSILTKVEIEISNASGNVNVVIKTNSDGWIDVSEVVTKAVTNGWNDFDFENITVTPGQTYTISVTSDCGPHWKYGNNTYPDGEAIWQSMSQPDEDYNFMTFGYDPETDDPEEPADTGDTAEDETAGETATTETLGQESASIAKPTSLTAKFSDEKNAVELSWKASSTADIDGYKIFRSESYSKGYVKIGDTKKDILTYLDEDYTAGKTYYYQVRAYKDSEQSASSNIASATVPSDVAPAKPKVSVVDTTTNSLTARWKKSEATNLAGYTINLYKGSEKVRTKDLSAKTNEYSFLDLDAGTLYKVELIAKDNEDKTSSPAYALGITKMPEWWVQIASTFNLAASLVIIVLIGFLVVSTIKTMRKKRA